MGLLILVLSWNDDVAECRWGSGCMNPAVVCAAVSSTATVIVWKHCNFFVILCFMIDFVFVFVFVFVSMDVLFMVVLFMDDVCSVLMMCARVSFV